jgi:ribosomal protein S18 acetylase RimI-like enzyme
LRPFRLSRDLGAVARLIERAFADEDADDRLTVRDVTGLRLMAPFVGLVGLVHPAARDIFAGFVWERDGAILGNVTIGRLGTDATRWMIGNVAVDPAARRSGIARRLTRAALDEIERRGGQVTILDVRADNEPAYALYRSLGFLPIDRTLDLRRPARPDQRAVAPTVRPLRAREWRALATLLEATTPERARRYLPIEEHQVMTRAVLAGLGVAGRVIAGVQTTILVTGDERGRLTGAAEIEVRGGRTAHRLKVTVHPAARGRVAHNLVLAALAVVPPGGVRAEVRASDETTQEALRDAGFTPVRILDRLVYAHSAKTP